MKYVADLILTVDLRYCNRYDVLFGERKSKVTRATSIRNSNSWRRRSL